MGEGSFGDGLGVGVGPSRRERSRWSGGGGGGGRAPGRLSPFEPALRRVMLKEVLTTKI